MSYRAPGLQKGRKNRNSRAYRARRKASALSATLVLKKSTVLRGGRA